MPTPLQTAVLTQQANPYPGALIASSALASLNTTGTVAVASVGLRAGLVVSNITVLVGTTAGVAMTHQWAALTDSTLTVKAVSADGTSGALPGSTLKTYAMGSPFTVPATGVYYLAVSVTATTAPTLAGVTPAGAASGLVPVLCGTAGSQSAPPSLAAQLASGVVTFNGSMNFAAWVS